LFQEIFHNIFRYQLIDYDEKKIYTCVLVLAADAAGMGN
jgi:hypothetical protein